MMNPDTNLFEPIEPAGPEKFIRSDGTPAPDHWPRFREGEKLIIKGYEFSVGRIGSGELVLFPQGWPNGPRERHQKILQGNPKRKRK